MTAITIQLDSAGESQVLVATREVRNSDHPGTLEAGERVFFRNDDAGLLLAYETGEPTNGSQYARFASVTEAEDFARRAGLAEA